MNGWAYDQAEEARRLKKNACDKARRDRRRDAGICIDEPRKGPEHGEVFQGGRCKLCWTNAHPKAVPVGP